jgi:uncharacterized protein YrrD
VGRSARPISGVIEDLGHPISHLALEEGAAVYDRSGRRVGVVDQVITDKATAIFEGLIVRTFPLPLRHLYANPEHIAELRERGVLLSVDGDALHDVSKASARATGSAKTLESRLRTILRRGWDWITGFR